MVPCDRLCISFDVNKIAKSPFWLLSVTTLEQWGLDKSDIAKLLSLIRISHLLIFNWGPYSLLATYHIHINKYINTTSYISIRCLVKYEFVLYCASGNGRVNPK